MTIPEALLAASGSPAVSILVKAAIASAAGLCAMGVARRSRAAARHALLAAMFMVLAVLPIAAVLAPPLRIVVRLGREALSAAPRGASSRGALSAPTQRTPTAPAAPAGSLSLDDLLLMNARVVRSLGLGLDEKALDAVRQWRFRPAMDNGKAVAAKVVVQVTFRLL